MERRWRQQEIHAEFGGGGPFGKWPLERPRRMWDNNIKREVLCKNVNWNELAKYHVHWLTLSLVLRTF